MSAQNLYVEALTSNVTVFEVKKELRLNEVIRVEP